MKNIKTFSGMTVLNKSIREIIFGQISLDENDTGNCPICQSANASFHLLNEYHCFYCDNCGCQGDPITVMRLLNKYSFLRALEYMTDKGYINYKSDKISCMPSHEQEIFQEIFKEGVQFYHEELINCPIDYIEEKGLSKLPDEKLLFGFANGGLPNHLLFDKYFPLESCMNTGLFNDNVMQADIFNNALVYPNIIDSHIVGITSIGGSILEVVSIEF